MEFIHYILQTALFFHSLNSCFGIFNNTSIDVNQTLSFQILGPRSVVYINNNIYGLESDWTYCAQEELLSFIPDNPKQIIASNINVNTYQDNPLVGQYLPDINLFYPKNISNHNNETCSWSTSRFATYPNWNFLPTIWRRLPLNLMSSMAISCKSMALHVHYPNSLSRIVVKCSNENPYSLSAPHNVIWSNYEVSSLNFKRKICWSIRDTPLDDVFLLIHELFLVKSYTYQHLFIRLLPIIFPLCLNRSFECEFVDRVIDNEDASNKHKYLENIYDLHIRDSISRYNNYDSPHLVISLKRKSDIEELYHSLLDNQRIEFLIRMMKTNSMRIKFCTRRSRYSDSILSRNESGLYIECLSTSLKIEKEHFELFIHDMNNATSN